MSPLAVAPEPAVRAGAATVAVIGNPNTGKSALFNALTGLRQRVGNYPGVTVEKLVGRCTVGGRSVELVDLPGTYSLAAHSPDEMVAVDVLAGTSPGTETPDAVLVVVDATNLRRNLFLLEQIRELGLPMVVALNMADLADQRGVRIDSGELGRRLGVEIVPTVATTGRGLDELRAALERALERPVGPVEVLLPELRAAARALAHRLAERGTVVSHLEVERALLDAGGTAETRLESRCEAPLSEELARIRTEIGAGTPLAALEARRRYARIAELLEGLEERDDRTTAADRLDRWMSHPVLGTAVFFAVMALVFQGVFRGAEPLMQGIDAGISWLGATLAAWLPPGALSSLLVDGAVAGVGSVLVFLPQILLLFAFLLVLEDTGYMARAAFLMDRLMRSCGLSGHSFIPMLSSFACAVPGIMATRVIRDRRDRLATILAAPFMTCSARLPVYALLIAAFVPRRSYLGGAVGLQGLVLLGLYLLGIAGGVVTASVLKRTLLRGPTPPFLMEMPPFRRPQLRSLLFRLLDRGRIFVVRAGSFIFAAALVIWALAYFPRPAALEGHFASLRTEAEATLGGSALETRLHAIEGEAAAAFLEQSLLGRTGRAIEPLFRPLGWDWKISASVVASFPAREVVLAALGTTYALGSEVGADDEGLIQTLREARDESGRRVFSLPVALGLMVFVALNLQCVSTIAIMRRETRSWRWPLLAWSFMTAVAWLGAFLAVHLATAAGWA